MSALPKGPICVEYGSVEAHSAMVLIGHLPAIPQLLQVGFDGGVQLAPLGYLLAAGGGEPAHLFFERFVVILLRLGADVAAGREHVAVLPDLLQRCALTEAGDVLV